ncbi:putative RNA-directed DNA polymerase, partial [Tanacetum coccineum]
MAATESNDSPLPLATILHMITIKLTSSNYLLWKNQLLPLLAYQKLTGYVDGSIAAPDPTIVNNDVTSPNPDYNKWIAGDQRALLLIQASLSEEAMAETLGHTTSKAVWSALADAYSHDSIKRMHTLRDSLRHLQKGTSTVAEYSRKFKAICDQLNAIGHPLDESDKIHWFLCGLGSTFETFSTTQRLIRPRPKFCDLLSQAESHELFLSSMNCAPAHMTPSLSTMDSVSTYSDVLVVPHLTKNLLSVSKLTKDNLVDVTFSDDVFIIQIRFSKTHLAQGRHKNGLYILEREHHAFLYRLSSTRLKAS